MNVWAIPTDYSMDSCLAKDWPIRINATRVEPGMIPGGRCAVLLHGPGNTNNLEPAEPTRKMTPPKPSAIN